MSWMLTSIERHLERVRLIESANLTDAGVGPDLVHHEAMLVRLFERAETMAVDDKTQRRLSYALHDHLRRDVEWWVEELHWGMLAGFGAELDAAARRNLIDWMLAVECQLDELTEVPAPSSSRQIWLERLLETASRRDEWQGDNHPWRIVPRYCERLGLVTSRPHAPRLRLPGHTWLRLRGPDRLRWLLALESEQAVGDTDPWLASTAQRLLILANAGRTFFSDDEDPLAPAAWSGIRRWESIGLLHGWDSEEYDAFGYRLTDTGERLLRRDDDDVNELFVSLARAQAQDDRREALGPDNPGPSTSELAATTMRHARLVAHEVRNALLPVRFALKKVWRELDDREATKLATPREQIERGINRLYDFVEASVRMSASVDELPPTFVVLDAIEEARRALPELAGISLVTIPGAANPLCRGNRSRFVLVLLNLLRNAIQAGGPRVALAITVDASPAATFSVTIDDDGPGVPAHLHDYLFESGTSSHANGTGHGLALVREVVVTELGGTISHTIPPGGGARFRITLPSVQEPSR